MRATNGESVRAALSVIDPSIGMCTRADTSPYTVYPSCLSEHVTGSQVTSVVHLLNISN